jgi:hypothetical protein
MIDGSSAARSLFARSISLLAIWFNGSTGSHRFGGSASSSSASVVR